MNWLAELADGGQHTAATLKVYKAGVANWNAEYADPDCLRPNPGAMPAVKKVLAGIERVQAERAQQRPIVESPAGAQPLLFTTLQKLKFPNTSLARMHRAAAYLGVAAGLRPGELLGNADDPSRALRREQLKFYQNSAATVPVIPPGAGDPPRVMEITLRLTKTSQFAQVTKFVQAPDAVSAVWEWYCETAGRAARAQLFQLSADALKGITTAALTKYLERRHSESGLGKVRFTGKSWRRGGASTLAIQGYTPEVIASLGWATGSESWKKYANDPIVQRQRAIALSQQMQDILPRRTAGGHSPPRRSA